MSINNLETKISQAHANNSETASLLDTLCAKLGIDPGPESDAKGALRASTGAAVINGFICSLDNLGMEQAANNALLTNILAALFSEEQVTPPPNPDAATGDTNAV